MKADPVLDLVAVGVQPAEINRLLGVNSSRISAILTDARRRGDPRWRHTFNDDRVALGESLRLQMAQAEPQEGVQPGWHHVVGLRDLRVDVWADDHDHAARLAMMSNRGRTILCTIRAHERFWWTVADHVVAPLDELSVFGLALRERVDGSQ